MLKLRDDVRHRFDVSSLRGDGIVWAKTPLDIEYHNDVDETADAHNDRGEVTVGGIGYVDADGYLYLTDRKSFMIVSGGVNSYPQEVENLLITHPKVFAVAVVGVPNDEWGEEVQAVVQPVPSAVAGPDLEAELIAFCRERLAGFKCPSSVGFHTELPRLDTGKHAVQARRP